VTRIGRSQWIGRPLRRLEDENLLQGKGRFTADFSLPGELHAQFVRSPHPHARIRTIDLAAARATPGVIAVYTGADLLADGLKSMPFLGLHKRPDGSPITAPPRMPLAIDVARFVGDAVAMVVAESREIARDAADLVEIDWEPLPAVVDATASAQPGAPVVWEPAADPERGNIVALFRNGDVARVDAAIAGAHRVVRLRVVNNRVMAHPLELKAALADFEATSGRLTVWCPVQGVHRGRADLATVLGMPESAIRVIVADLGGGFGARAYGHPEYAAVAWAARALARPVKWVGERSELFLSDVHGRDQVTELELAIDADLRFTGLRIRTIANIGAYISYFGTAVPAMSGTRTATGAYDIGALDHEVAMVFTHTAPVDAYRGAGRPEMGYALERLVHKAALELRADPVTLKRRNFVRPAQMPYRNQAGHTYECAAFEQLMDAALRAADWHGFEARRRAAEARGRLLGHGVATYIEATGSGLLTEEVDVVVAADGKVTVVCGTQSMGQGLKTSFAQIAAERLQIDPARVVIFEGDSAVVRSGGGSGGSRSLQVGGNAVLAGAEATVAHGRALAAQALEAAAADIEYAAGTYRVAGTDRGVSLFELASRDPAGRFTVTASATQTGQTWPNGNQAAEVEIDPETGVIDIRTLVAVDDIGTVINPLIAHGQIHGGIVQGIGQAMLENIVYDPESGQLLTGSLLDYAMPRAADLPAIDAAFDESLPTAVNRLGAKGVGESGTHGAIPAFVNAVVDALAPLGITHLDMPLTPEKIWRAILDAQSRRA
jgi:carbon-monoxide dehydrogenase large subunit